MTLVTLEQAKKHRRVPLTVSDEDDDLNMKIEQAQAIVLDYIADSTNATWTATVAAWTDETVPRSVQAAILIQLRYLDRFRGDDDTEPQQTSPGDIAPGAKACVYRLRQPVVA